MGVKIFVLLPVIVNVLGLEAAPGVALDVCPGVINKTHVPPLGAILPQELGAMVVPDGKAGDGLYVTFNAVLLKLVLVMVICLGVPVNAALPRVQLPTCVGQLTERAKAVTLADKVALPGVSERVMFKLLASLG